MLKPLVAIRCLVYNHESYLYDFFEGIVNQQTTFPYIAVVHDDCSTDNSAAIIHEYAEKYPDIIKPIYEEVNCYQNGQWNQANAKINMAINEAKYIAFCEGDDYWTDPYKLQKQVDFMEAHPECTVTFHRYNILQQEEQTWRKDACDVYLKPDQSEVQLTIPMYFKHWVTQPCTMMYRYGTYMGQDKPYREYKDQHFIFHLLNEGIGYLLNFNGAVYREHNGGIHSKTPVLSQSRLAVIVAHELYSYNKQVEGTKENYINTLDWGIECEKRYSGKDQSFMRSFILQRLVVSKSIKKAIAQLIRK